MNISTKSKRKLFAALVGLLALSAGTIWFASDSKPIPRTAVAAASPIPSVGMQFLLPTVRLPSKIVVEGREVSEAEFHSWMRSHPNPNPTPYSVGLSLIDTRFEFTTIDLK